MQFSLARMLGVLCWRRYLRYSNISCVKDLNKNTRDLISMA